jgi:hypothetical protein
VDHLEHHNNTKDCCPLRFVAKDADVIFRKAKQIEEFVKEHPGQNPIQTPNTVTRVEFGSTKTASEGSDFLRFATSLNEYDTYLNEKQLYEGSTAVNPASITVCEYDFLERPSDTILPSIGHKYFCVANVNRPEVNPHSYCGLKDSTTYVPNGLPHIFTKLSPNLKLLEFNYLSRHDALTMPSKGLQMELLHSYVDCIHPHLPFIDLKNFLNIGCHRGEFVRGQNGARDSDSQISFLLFQAVMFAGCTTIGLKYLIEAGYTSRAEAETVLFQRVRLLYDFDTCNDRHSTLQALLLMSYTKSVSSDRRGNGHWLDLAISLAFSLDLHKHRDHEPLLIDQQRLERRLWWCVFVLDRMMAMTGRQTMIEHYHQDGGITEIRSGIIRQEDCDVPMLCLDDFGVDQFGDEEESERRSRHHAQRFIEKAILSWHSNSTPMSPRICCCTSSRNLVENSTLIRSSCEVAQPRFSGLDSVEPFLLLIRQCGSEDAQKTASKADAHPAEDKETVVIDDPWEMRTLAALEDRDSGGHDEFSTLTPDLGLATILIKETTELKESESWSKLTKEMSEAVINCWKYTS